jgi:WD40-like Beta Propeller Repeat
MKASAGLLVAAGAFLSTGTLAEPKFSPWGPAVNLAADEFGVLHCGGINTEFNDAGPAVSKGGLSLYFSSGRPGNVGDDPDHPLSDTNDIYVVQRRSVDSAWGTPTNLRNINSSSVDSVPTFSRDEHWMFFNSTRGPNCSNAAEAAPYCGHGDFDIWVSYRRHVHDDFAWETPMNLPAGATYGRPVNTDQFDAGPGYWESEEGKAFLYFNRGRPGPAGATNPSADIWVAQLMPDGTFDNAQPVPELNSPELTVPGSNPTIRYGGDQRPTVRFDGLEVIFYSNRDGSLLAPDGKTPSTDLWVSTRKSVDDRWGKPVNLVEVNTPAGEFHPQLSSDGLTLYFASNRSGGCECKENDPRPACKAPGTGPFDIWMTTRTRIRGND